MPEPLDLREELAVTLHAARASCGCGKPFHDEHRATDAILAALASRPDLQAALVTSWGWEAEQLRSAFGVWPTHSRYVSPWMPVTEEEQP